MGWKETDERLIKRGELILDLNFLQDYKEELKAMNKGKVGPPIRLTPKHYPTPHHNPVPLQNALPPTLEGFTRSLHKLVPKLPPADYSGLRKRILVLPVDPYQSLNEKQEPISIAVDSTGVKVNRAGGCG